MNLSYTHLIDENLHPKSRVWVYQLSRLLSMSEAFDAEDMINDFTKAWQSHGADVKAAGYLFFGQFIVLVADESQVTVGGCSTDSSVRFIKTVEQRFKVDCFNRQALAFVVKDKVEVIPYGQLQYAYDNGFITNDTLYFNNLVNSKEQLENNWIIPVKESWLASKLSSTPA